jgi:hypothetical protein
MDWVISQYVLSLHGLPLLPTRVFVTVTQARSYFVSTVSLSNEWLQFQDLCESSVTQNMLWWRILALCQTPILKDHPCQLCDCLFNEFTATVNIWWPWLSVMIRDSFLKMFIFAPDMHHKLENDNKNTTKNKFKTCYCWSNYYSLQI